MFMSLIKPPIKVVFHVKIIFISKYIQCVKFKAHMTSFAKINFNLDNLFLSKLDIYKKVTFKNKKYFYNSLYFSFERQNYETKSLREASIGFILNNILLDLDKNLKYFVRVRPIFSLASHRTLYYASEIIASSSSEKSLFIEINKNCNKNKCFSTQNFNAKQSLKANLNKNKKIEQKPTRISTRIRNKIIRLGII